MARRANLKLIILESGRHDVRASVRIQYVTDGEIRNDFEIFFAVGCMEKDKERLRHTGQLKG
jgi:hypothetical protein